MTAARVDLLPRFLADSGREAPRWGESDCLMFMANWLVASRGVDPASGWRGVYQSRREAKEITAKAGGIEAHVDRCLSSVGAIRTITPARGDVGLVRANIFEGGDSVIVAAVGAICVSPKLWAVKLHKAAGIAVDEFPLIGAWTLRA